MQSRQEQGAGSTIVLARPFPKDVDEQRVHAVFAVYGRITKVRLRFQQSNLQQKDSVYIEFESSADADTAVSNPPLQLGSTSDRLQCLHKRDYEQQQRSFPQSSSLGTSTGKQKQGSADSVQDNAANLGSDHEESRKRRKLAAAQAKQMDELQAALKREQAQTETLKEAVKMAQQEASNAKATEKLAQSQLISKNVETSSLKGQLEAAVKRAKANAESVHAQYRPKVQSLEGQVQQLKDALETELSRNRRRTLPKFEL
ncbi:TPA: hypothetical protein ACH3X3_012370 [Trebouxia sp. C0006]